MEITLNASIFPTELEVSKFPAHRGLKPDWPDGKVIYSVKSATLKKHRNFKTRCRT